MQFIRKKIKKLIKIKKEQINKQKQINEIEQMNKETNKTKQIKMKLMYILVARGNVILGDNFSS